MIIGFFTGPNHHYFHYAQLGLGWIVGGWPAGSDGFFNLGYWRGKNFTCKKDILRWTIGCHIFFERSQLGLFLYLSKCAVVVSFQMSLQTAWIRGCKVTLFAFVRLFATVNFQMCSQSAYIGGCKVTLFAFVWLFPTVCFQMCPQITCSRGSRVTLVAFVWLFSAVCFQMCP